MAFRDDIKTILASGIPGLLELPAPQAAQQANTQPEQIAPEPQIKDFEAFNIGGTSVRKSNVFVAGAAALGLLAAFLVLRR